MQRSQTKQKAESPKRVKPLNGNSLATLEKPPHQPSKTVDRESSPSFAKCAEAHVVKQAASVSQVDKGGDEDDGELKSTLRSPC
jgi:hypothetical protein